MFMNLTGNRTVKLCGKTKFCGTENYSSNIFPIKFDLEKFLPCEILPYSAPNENSFYINFLLRLPRFGSTCNKNFSLLRLYHFNI